MTRTCLATYKLKRDALCPSNGAVFHVGDVLGRWSHNELHCIEADMRMANAESGF